MRRFYPGLILAFSLVAALPTVYASHEAECLKTQGIAACVRKFATEWNQDSDLTLQQRGVPTRQTTKVVPILHIGVAVIDPGRATLGAAQVAGPAEAVRKVQAVAAFDGAGATTPTRYLVPVDSLERWKQLRRVVGVSAIIQVRTCNAWPDPPAQGCR